MRLLILTHHFPPEFSGDATMQWDLARHMAGAGHRVTVVTTYPHHHMLAGSGVRLPARDRVDGFDLIRMRTPHWTRKYLPVRLLQDLMAETAYVFRSLFTGPADVVVLWSPPITLTLLASALKWIRGAKILMYMHDAFPELLVSMGIIERGSLTMRVGEWLESLAYRLADYVAVHSPRNRAHVMARSKRPEATHVWPLWLDTEAVHPMPRENAFVHQQGLSGRFVVMYAGTVGHAMGVTTIPQAADALRDHPEIEFAVAGAGTHLPALEQEIRRRKLTNLRLLPLRPREGLAEMLAAADVLLVCLRSEKTDNPNGYFRAVVPHKLLTCMAAGRPILASTEPEGDLARLIHISDCGLVAAAEDAQALARAVLRMQASEAKRQEWGENARRFAVRYFSSQTQLPLLEGILSALAEGRVEAPATVWSADPVASSETR